jgi:UDP-2,3-diacylglucosamine pyrophosphatase LpxH
MSAAPDRDLVVVADVHVGRNDPELPEFLAFLAALSADTDVLVLLGDIFSLWLGEPRYTEAHHAAVLDACRDLRRRGVRVVFIEGNREFSVARWAGDAFDEVGDQMAAEPWAGRRWLLAHGDLLNREDRPGRLFRAAIRSAPARWFARALPRRWGIAIADRVESGLRHRNLRHKTAIPAERFARYADWFAGRGYDAGAIGHIHVEMTLDLAGPDGVARSLFVLPDWRSTRRYLRIPRRGGPFFTSWGAPREVAPAIVEVREERDRARLTFDRATGLAAGARVALDSGHGSGRRRGTVLSVDARDPRSLVLELDPGPPLQVGDRLSTNALQ